MDSKRNWVGAASYRDPYGSANPKRFCGRDKEIREILHLIDNNILTTIYGKSGVGKTSLLNAGVFPQLREKLYIPFYVRLGRGKDKKGKDKSFQRQIIEKLEEGIKNIEVLSVKDEQGSNYLSKFITEDDKKENSNRYLWQYFATRQFKNEKGEIIFPVIVLDQFEEVVRQVDDISHSPVNTLLDQIAYLTDESHAIPDLNLDCEKNYTYQYHFNYRFLIAIREDELSYLEDRLDNSFLFSLKRNRYRLNNLSEEGVKKIISIPGESFFEGDFEDIIKEISEYVKEKEQNAYSAFLLSVVLSLLEEMKIENVPVSLSDVKKVIEMDPLSTLYYKATEKLSKKEKNYIERVTVDEYNHRVPIPCGDFMKNAPNYYKVIIENEKKDIRKDNYRILQLTGKTGHSEEIELVHDRLCFVINNEREKKKKKKYENVIVASLLFIVLAGFVLWLHSGPIDVVRIAADNGIGFLQKELLIGVNFILLIPLFVSLAKQLQISRKLSLIVLLMTVICCYLSLFGIDLPFSDELSKTNIVLSSVFIIITISSYAVSGYMKEPMRRNWIAEIWDSLPLRIVILLFSGYVFYLCIWSAPSAPIHSCWGLIVIPLLLNEVCGMISDSKFRRSSYISWIVLLLILLFNVIVNFWIPLAIIVIIIIGMAYPIHKMYSAFQKNNCVKHFVVILGNIVCTIMVFIMNLGYNPLEINYSSVEKIENWSCVVASNGKFKGLIESYNGDTLLPYVFDSIDINKSSAFLKIHDSVDVPKENSLERVDSNSKVYKYKFYLKVLKNSNDARKTKDKFYSMAAQCHHEIVNASFEYLRTSSIDSFEKNSNLYEQLFSIQRIVTDSLSGRLENLQQSLDSLNIKDTIQIKDFDIEVLKKIYKEISQYYILSTMLTQLDYKNYSAPFDLLNGYGNVLIPKSFNDMRFKIGYTYRISISKNIMVNDDKTYNKEGLFNFKFNYTDEMHKADSFILWYHHILNTILQDMNFIKSSDLIISNIELLDDMKDSLKTKKDRFETSLKQLKSGQDDKNSLGALVDFLSYTDHLKNSLKRIQDGKISQNQINEYLYLHYNEQNIMFEYLQKKIFEIFPAIIERYPYGTYNNQLASICGFVYAIGKLHRYDMDKDAEKVMQKLWPDGSDEFFDFMKSY